VAERFCIRDHNLFPCLQVLMVTGSGSGSHGGGSQSREDDVPVTYLLGWLNLTKDEEEFMSFSDDEEAGDGGGSLEFALIGKVLSPSPLHISTITSTMKPMWGDPFGLRLRSVGDRADNLFIAEFGSNMDKQRALEGSPWVVGRYTVILQEYDETLKTLDVSFAAVVMWVHILDLSFSWMNAKRGATTPSLIGVVKKVEADADGKVSGPFLRARIVIDISMLIRRGILLKKDKSSAPPEWFQI
jgi:hypothetical protein